MPYTLEPEEPSAPKQFVLEDEQPAQPGEWQDWWENSNLKSGIYDRAVAAANLPHALISQNVQEAKNLYGLATGERSAAEAWEASPTVELAQSALSPLMEFGSGGDPVEEAANLAMIGTPLRPAAPAGPRLLPRTTANTPAPTAAQLKEAGGADMTAARKMGVDFDPEAVAKMATDLRTDLIENAINAKVAPAVFETLDDLANIPAVGPGGERIVVQFSDLETAKNTLRDARLDFAHPQQRGPAERVIAELDRLLEGQSPESVVAGPAAAAGERYTAGKANYAAAKRSERLTGTADERAEGKSGILPRAEGRAGATHSGANLDNVIRQRVDDLLENPKLRSGFSEAEITELKRVRDGTRARNALRRTGKLFGGGGGLGQLATLGTGGGLGAGLAAKLAPSDPLLAALIGVPVTLAPVATGIAARKAADSATKRALQVVDEQVRKRSPLFEELLKSPVVKRVTDPGKRAAMVKALLLAAQEAQAAERASHTYGPGGNTL